MHFQLHKTSFANFKQRCWNMSELFEVLLQNDLFLRFRNLRTGHTTRPPAGRWYFGPRREVAFQTQTGNPRQMKQQQNGQNLLAFLCINHPMQMISIQESTNNHFDPLKSKWKETWIKIPWCDTQSWVAPRGRRGRSDIYIYIHTYIYIYIIYLYVVLVTTSMVVILKQLAETKKVSKVAKWSGTPMKHLKDIVVHKQRLSKTTPFQRILTGLPQKTDSSPG